MCLDIFDEYFFLDSKDGNILYLLFFTIKS